MSQAKTASKTKAKLSPKDRRRQAQARQTFRARLAWGAAGLILVGSLGYFGWQIARPRPGVSVPQMASPHILLGDTHEPYNSDPPTSGPHAAPVEAGFYSNAVPDESLVHNLEHGYVVIWYDCAGLEDSACTALEQQIQAVMAEAGGAGLVGGATKLIAAPRTGLGVPIAAASWGRLLKQATPDWGELAQFIQEFRNRAPEAGAP